MLLLVLVLVLLKAVVSQVLMRMALLLVGLLMRTLLKRSKRCVHCVVYYGTPQQQLAQLVVGMCLELGQQYLCSGLVCLGSGFCTAVIIP